MLHTIPAWRSAALRSYHGLACAGADSGRLFGIFASIAEFERELIRERVRSGMAAAGAAEEHERAAMPPPNRLRGFQLDCRGR